MGNLSILQQISAWALPVLFAITVHEVAHGWMANKLGDPTAKMLGRLTLNPVKHIDLWGTIIVPLILFKFGGFIFGWAKPVPVTAQNLRNPKRDMAIVALAGPMVNFLMAIFWAIFTKLGMIFEPQLGFESIPFVYMGLAGVTVNLVLGTLNLIPIPPLDGGRILSGFARGRFALFLHKIEPYGFLVLIALMVTGVLGWILGPIVHSMRGVLMISLGIS